MTQTRIVVSENKDELFAATAKLIVESSREAIARSGRFALVLTGGSTPKSLYELLASDEWKTKIDWSKVHLFWGDERFVPASDEQSNYRMAKKALLDRLELRADQIHRVVTENTTPELCARAYESDILKFFGVAEGIFPSFDFVLNGMGSNRHVLSLFPGRPTIHEKKKLVVADFIPEVHMDRITMTAPLVNEARRVVFLVAGRDKAEAVNDVLFGAKDVDKKPAQVIQPNGECIWMLDKDAAAQVPTTS